MITTSPQPTTSLGARSPGRRTTTDLAHARGDRRLVEPVSRDDAEDPQAAQPVEVRQPVRASSDGPPYRMGALYLKCYR